MSGYDDEVELKKEEAPEFGSGRARVRQYWRYDEADEQVGNVMMYCGTFFSHLKPALLSSVAFIDPGNLESDLMAAEGTGYALLWVVFWATVGGWFVQTLSARLGVVTGQDLAAVIRQEYSRWAATALWVAAELSILGVDIQALLGSAIGLQVLFGLDLWVCVTLTAMVDVLLFLLLDLQQNPAKNLLVVEYVTAALVMLTLLAFAVNFILGSPDVQGIALGWFVPTVPAGAGAAAIALVGANIMPHNLFLFSSLASQQEVDRSKQQAINEENSYMMWSAALAYGVTFLINLFVVAVFATAFFGTSTFVGLQGAGKALEQYLGTAASYVWGIALLAAGQASTVAAATTGRAVLSGLLDKELSFGIRHLAMRCVGTPVSLVAAVGLADMVLQIVNVLQALMLPLALLPLLFLLANPRVMGQYRTSTTLQVVAGVGVAVVLLANGYQLVMQQLPGHWVVVGVYAALMILLVVDFALQLRQGFAVGSYGSRGSDADEREALLRPAPSRV